MDKELNIMEKIEVRIQGQGNSDSVVFQILYDGELLTEELVSKDSPLFRMEVKDVAEKLLRNLESLYEHVFNFRDFEELTLMPARQVEMDEAGHKLRRVRLALKELSKVRVGA